MSDTLASPPLPRLARLWQRLGPGFMPFADAATPELPMPRLLRLSLFQVSVGMAYALMVGTLNRVMIIELGMAAWVVALMVALPLLAAPWRARIGFHSDTHRSVLGWRRVPYLWFGSLLQFGGLSIMPFALVLSTTGGAFGSLGVGAGHAAAALAFLLVGAGMQTTQTAGLALATDLAPVEARPRVVAMLYLMLLVGMGLSSLALGLVLRDFSATRLVQVVQGAAVLTMLLNGVALWKQEPRGQRQSPATPEAPSGRQAFAEAWRSYASQPGARRFLVAVGLGTAAFNMQDIVLEPYGAAVMHLPVGATSQLTALVAGGSMLAFALAARQLRAGCDPQRLAAWATLVGVAAFAAVIFAAPLQSAALFRLGTLLIGVGGGLFAVCTLVVAMGLSNTGRAGLALGAWGAVQATAGGLAVALGGALRDAVGSLGQHGWLGEVMAAPSVGYSVVYHLEIALLFATLIAIGPLVRRARSTPTAAPVSARPLGLAEFPG